MEFNETDAVVSDKVLRALDYGLNVIVCIGENLLEREAGVMLDVTAKQLTSLKDKIPLSHWTNIVIAYEPIWTRKTGEVATTE